MYDDYLENYNTQPTYQDEYDDYLSYESSYNRFVPRQVNSFPYANNSSMMYSKPMIDNKTELENEYPEVYKKILPIIESRLRADISIMDNSTLERITFEVYDEFIKSDVGRKLNVQTNSIGVGCITNTAQVSKKEVNNKSDNIVNNGSNNSRFNSSKISNRCISTNSSQNTSSRVVNQDLNKYAQTNAKESSNKHARSNCLLCDLIKIIILNKWKEHQRPPKPGPRPPVRPNPRPPIPWSQNIMPSASNYYEQNIPTPEVNYRPTYFDVPYPEDFGQLR